MYFQCYRTNCCKSFYVTVVGCLFCIVATNMLANSVLLIFFVTRGISEACATRSIGTAVKGKTESQILASRRRTTSTSRTATAREGPPSQYQSSFGSSDCICSSCHARFWYEERLTCSTKHSRLYITVVVWEGWCNFSCLQ